MNKKNQMHIYYNFNIFIIWYKQIFFMKDD